MGVYLGVGLDGGGGGGWIFGFDDDVVVHDVVVGGGVLGVGLHETMTMASAVACRIHGLYFVGFMFTRLI